MFDVKFYIMVGIVILVVMAVKIAKEFPGDDKKDLSVYQKKSFLFDTITEFNLFKILLELFGDTYHIFAQVNYSHIIEVRQMSFAEQRKYRSRIDRKSADFVLCDKDRVVPRLIIELDGGVHNFASKQKRDEFINELTKVVGLPILHLNTKDTDKEFIRSEVNKKLKL